MAHIICCLLGMHVANLYVSPCSKYVLCVLTESLMCSDRYSYGVAMTTLGAFNLGAALLFVSFPGASKADREATLAAERSIADEKEPTPTNIKAAREE